MVVRLMVLTSGAIRLLPLQMQPILVKYVVVTIYLANLCSASRARFFMEISP